MQYLKKCFDELLEIYTYHTDFRNTIEAGNGEVKSHIKGVTCKTKKDIIIALNLHFQLVYNWLLEIRIRRDMLRLALLSIIVDRGRIFAFKVDSNQIFSQFGRVLPSVHEHSNCKVYKKKISFDISSFLFCPFLEFYYVCTVTHTFSILSKAK